MPTHKQRCEFALQNYNVTPAMRETLYCLIAHLMTPITEQPNTLLTVLSQLAFTYSLSPSITKRDSARAEQIHKLLYQYANETERKDL